MDAAQWTKLRARLVGEAELTEDSLRFYFLGDNSSGGRLVRGDVVLFWLSDFNFSLPEDNSAELESLNDEAMEHFAEALRSHR